MVGPRLPEGGGAATAPAPLTGVMDSSELRRLPIIVPAAMVEKKKKGRAVGNV